MQAEYAEVEGARLLVRCFGAAGGRRVLYWHGGGGAGEEIAELAPALAAAGHSVYAPDAPGYRNPRGRTGAVAHRRSRFARWWLSRGCDDPDFDPSLDLAARTAELRARVEQGETWRPRPK